MVVGLEADEEYWTGLDTFELIRDSGLVIGTEFEGLSGTHLFTTF